VIRHGANGTPCLALGARLVACPAPASDGAQPVPPPAPPLPPPPSELLTIDEVALFLRTTPKAIRMRIDRGQLPGVVRLGRSVLVRRADLRKHLGLSGA
jgi:excisionase family DNA binding protein